VCQLLELTQNSFVSDKRTSLSHFNIDYDDKKFFNTGPLAEEK